MKAASTENPMSLGSPQPAPGQSAVDAEKSSYRQILRSSAVVGGASALTLLIGVTRTKAMAMILGPAGFGLMGMLTSIVDSASSVASMGINASGVRQIAASVGANEVHRIAATVMT